MLRYVYNSEKYSVRINHKKILSFSIIISSLSMASAGADEIKTFAVSFFDEKEATAPHQNMDKIINDITSVASDAVSDNKKPSALQIKKTASEKMTTPTFKERYNLQDAMLLTLQWHPKIKRAKYELERLKSVVDEAYSGYYPNVEMGLRSGMEKDDYTSEHNENSFLNLSLEQMLYDFGKTGDRVSLSELNVINSAYDVKKEINDLLYETIEAYLQVVRHDLLLVVLKNRIDGFSKIKEMTQKRVALGASAESDHSQASLRVAEAIANYNDYIAQQNKWSATLDKLTNTSMHSRIIMSFPAQIEDHYNKWSAAGMADIDSPAINIAQSKLDIARKQIDIEKNGHYPRITLNPYYEYDLAGNNSSNTYIHKNRDRYGVFFNVKVPLYQGGSISSKVQQATSALYAAQYNLDNEKNTTERKIMEYSSQIENTKLSLQSMLNKEQSAIRTRTLYMSQYINLGSRSISDLITSESEIHQTKLDIINNRYTVANLSLESLYYSGELINLLHIKGSHSG